MKQDSDTKTYDSKTLKENDTDKKKDVHKEEDINIEEPSIIITESLADVEILFLSEEQL